MKFNFTIGNIVSENVKAENINVGIECGSNELKETYSLIKTAIKELPETITQLKSSYDLINQYNTEINKGDEK